MTYTKEQIQSAAEMLTFKHLITKVYPSGIISIVSDTFDYWNTLTVIIPSLKEEILARTENAWGLSKVVIRPDSGNPVDIICGTVQPRKVESKEEAKNCITDRVSNETPHGEYGEDNPSDIFLFEGKYYFCEVEITWNRHDKQYYYMDDERIKKWEEVELDCVQKGSIETLWEIFGGTINEKGFKVLNSKIGLIYGDSITLERQEAILKRLMDKGFSSDNIVLGIGLTNGPFTK